MRMRMSDTTAISTTIACMRCKGCTRALTQTYQYVYVPASALFGGAALRVTKLAGPFCDDCANRRRAK